MAQHTSSVSQASVLRQAVLNTSSSLELLREAVSNAVDAEARHIAIDLINRGGDIWDITIEDDGNGMEDQHLMAFFNAGETVKDFPVLAIGEKGLGSKTTFVAKKVVVESIRKGTKDVLIGIMVDPLNYLERDQMPVWDMERNPQAHSKKIGVPHGTRVMLDSVRISSFNGKKTEELHEIANRTFHYLRSLCATGTVKNRHAQKKHIIDSVMNVGTIPQVTLHVTKDGHPPVNLGPEPGVYPMPDANPAPSTGPVIEGVECKSKNFCDLYDFHRSKTLSVGGSVITVHYDGTAIIAGEQVRQEMLRYELKQGWTQKSQMGMHLCKDFIPLRVDTSLSRELAGGEYYYEFKIFLNCQSFQLNADRNVITNEETDEVSWIWEDFRQYVWPNIEAKYKAYADLARTETAAIDARRKTEAAKQLKADYASLSQLPLSKKGAELAFVKEPIKEADVSHLFAMMIQSGHYSQELAPLMRFGRYIDDSTDIICEVSGGSEWLVEVERRLPSLFNHKHPMTSYEAVVVWELGGMKNGDSQVAPWGTGGGNVSIALIHNTGDNTWQLRWGTKHIPVYVLSDML